MSDLIKNDGFRIRKAEENDAGLILEFVMELAEYENAVEEVHATEESLKISIFKEKAAEVFIAEEDDEAVGFVLFFHNYSTWEAKKGLYLEDLFVRKKYRGKGYGKALLIHLAKVARERNCDRFEWACLDWNEPSIKFYKSLGAKPMDEWTVYRLDEELIDKLAEFDS